MLPWAQHGLSWETRDGRGCGGEKPAKAREPGPGLGKHRTTHPVPTSLTPPASGPPCWGAAGPTQDPCRQRGFKDPSTPPACLDSRSGSGDGGACRLTYGGAQDSRLGGSLSHTRKHLETLPMRRCSCAERSRRGDKGRPGRAHRVPPSRQGHPGGVCPRSTGPPSQGLTKDVVPVAGAWLRDTGPS